MNFLSILNKKGIIVIIIFLIFYVSIAIYVDIKDLVEHIKEINLIYVIPILLIFTLSLLIKSFRQLYYLKKINVRIPFKTNILIYFAGLSLVITPGGSGEIIKSHFLKKKYGTSISKTLPIVLIERYQDILAIFTVIVLFSVFTNNTDLIIPILIIGIALLVVTLIGKNRSVLEKFQKKIGKIKFLKFFKDSSTEFNDSIGSFSSNKSLFYGWLISLVAWLLDGVGIYLSLQAFNLNLNFITSTLIGFSSILFGAISLIPGGVGVTEVSMVQMLNSQGIDIALATAVTIFWRLASIWYSTCIGIIATNFVLKENSKEE